MKKTKAVILVAGKSTRTYPLTQEKPKALLNVEGKTIIEHNLDKLIDNVSEAILVVGYKKEMIQNFLGRSYKSIKLTFVEQKEQKGTGDALKCAKKLAGEHFIVMMGDDLVFKEDIQNSDGYYDFIELRIFKGEELFLIEKEIVKEWDIND